MDSKVRAGYAVSGYVVSGGLESAHQHPAAKLGKNLQDRDEEGIKLSIGKDGDCACSGRIGARNSPVRLGGVSVDGVPRLREAVSQCTTSHSASRAVENCRQVGVPAEVQCLRQKSRVDLDTWTATCGNTACNNHIRCVWRVRGNVTRIIELADHRGDTLLESCILDRGERCTMLV